MSSPRTGTIIASAAILILVVALADVAGATPDGRGSHARDTKVVKAIVSHWSPTTVRLSAGGSVKWKAISGTHTVTAFGAGWSFNHSLPQGSAATHRFTRAGTYRFRCTIHSTLVNGQCTGMCGKVVVSS
jgi:plastocyanin